MLAHCLYIVGVKSFPINKIVFVCAECLNPHMGPVDAANYTREPSLAARRETATKLIFSASGPEQATHLLPPLRQDFGRPTVSPMGCRKLPLTKKCNATRICSVGESAWFLFVCRCRSIGQIGTDSEAPRLKSRQEKFRVLTKHFFAYFWRNYWD